MLLLQHCDAPFKDSFNNILHNSVWLFFFFSFFFNISAVSCFATWDWFVLHLLPSLSPDLLLLETVDTRVHFEVTCSFALIVNRLAETRSIWIHRQRQVLKAVIRKEKEVNVFLMVTLMTLSSQENVHKEVCVCVSRFLQNFQKFGVAIKMKHITKTHSVQLSGSQLLLRANYGRQNKMINHQFRSIKTNTCKCSNK